MESVDAVVEQGQLKWQGTPPSLPDGTQVRVKVVSAPADSGNVVRARQALERLMARGTLGQSIPDPSAWQREQREDRPLLWKERDGDP